MAVLVFIFYLLVLLLAGGFAREQTSNVDDAIKLFAIYGAALSGFFTALVAFWNIRRQAKFSIELENIKAKLVRDIEGVKIRLSTENEAYMELMQAMTGLYNSMDVEKGNYSPQSSKDADNLLSNKSYWLERLHPDCAEPFNTFHQQLRFLREAFARDNDPVNILGLWREKKKDIKTFWDAFTAAVRTHHPDVAGHS